MWLPVRKYDTIIYEKGLIHILKIMKGNDKQRRQLGVFAQLPRFKEFIAKQEKIYEKITVYF